FTQSSLRDGGRSAANTLSALVESIIPASSIVGKVEIFLTATCGKKKCILLLFENTKSFYLLFMEREHCDNISGL
ncbi:hypothetical protein NZA98_33130, partial [Escherichia coli]|nr:hypothetical protein [Escherichia coli]